MAKYDWKNSNMALFGSDTDKQVKKEAAQEERAWYGAGTDIGIQIWRINKFQVEDWPKEEYGSFYSGDSYIILNTHGKMTSSSGLKYDVHFWIGKYSTQDEYGTAAYKTVELDTYLDDKPIQHREVQGHECPLFKKYFPVLSILKGGCATGFRRALPEAYQPRFIRIKKESSKRISMTQLAFKKGNYSEDDVFIVDLGKSIYQINGSSCSKDEKFKAAQQVQNIRGSRGECRLEVVDGCPFETTNIGDLFLDADKKDKEETVPWKANKVFKVSGNSLEELGDNFMDVINPGDVFVIETETMCYVWVGSGASIDERRNAIPYAANYIHKTERPWLPISVVSDGKERLHKEFATEFGFRK